MEQLTQNTVFANINFFKECLITLPKAETSLNFVDMRQSPAISNHRCMWEWEREGWKIAEGQPEVEG